MQRKKDKTKPSPKFLFLTCSTSLAHSWLLYFLPPSSTGNGGCGKSITVPLCLSFLCILFLFCRVAPSHGLQHFRINLLQHGFSMDHSSFRACPPANCDPFLQCGCLLQCDLLQGESLLRHLEHPVLWLWCLQGCFSQPSTHSSLTVQHFTLSHTGLSWGTAIVAAGFSCALWSVRWSWKWLCSAQSLPLPNKATLQPPHQHPVHCFNHNFSAAEDWDRNRRCLHGKTG